MLTKELAAALAAKSKLTQDQASRFLTALKDVATHEMAEGPGEFSLHGIGKFKAIPRSARTGRNPKTGEPVQIEQSWSISFKASSTLKAALG